MEPSTAIISSTKPKDMEGCWVAFVFGARERLTEKRGGWGFCNETEIHLESLTVCLSLLFSPDGRGLRSGTAVAQSIRQPSLKPV